MKSILRSTAILSSSSAVSILVSLVAAKAWALLLGASGLGYMGLLQSLAGLSAIIAGMGISTGLVRDGANAIDQGNHARVRALAWAAWFWAALLGSGTALVLIGFHQRVSQMMLGSPDYGRDVIIVALSLFFTLAASVQTGLLNAYHRVSALAKIGMLNALVGTFGSLALVLVWGERGVGLTVAATACIGWLVSRHYLRAEVAPESARPDRHEVVAAARNLIRFGGPYTASQLVGTGVQMVLPVLVLYVLGQESVGFYRAALSIAAGYLGFLLLAMSQDYYPRIAAVRERAEDLVFLANQQLRLVLLLCVPLILGLLALAPYLVPLIYTPEFVPTVEVLEWYLVGDLFKFASWTLGYAVLARSGSMTLFVVELASGVNILISSWYGMIWLGVAGLGIGFLVTYIVHLFLVWLILRREIGLRITPFNWRLLGVALVAAIVVRLLPILGLASLRAPVAFSLAVGFGLFSALLLWREVGGITRLRAWLQPTQKI